MKSEKTVLLAFMIFIISIQLRATAIYSNGNGNWTNAASWLKNGVPALPACGDTVYIQAGHTITENAHLDYTACSSLNIIIDGTLQFTNGNKLDLPCGSFVYIRPGGLVKKATAGGGNSTYIEICNVTFWDAGMGSLSGPVYLPVTLLYFNGKPSGENEVTLSWATASESDNDYFIIERASDDETYSFVSKVDGAGNSNEIRLYYIIDPAPFPRINYYRLSQADYNGERHYFTPIAVTLKKKGDIKFISNLSPENEILFYFDGETIYNCELAVSNIQGKLIFKTENVRIETGINSVSVNDCFLSSGIYFITIKTEGETFQNKMIIQNSFTR